MLKTNTPCPMKSWFSKTMKPLGTFTACLFLSSSPLLNAGLIDLLRGEPSEPALQRVAFVGTANVKEVQGEVLRLAGVERWVHLKNGDKLNPGDIVKTSSGCAVLSMVESESFVKVTPNTLCRIVPIQSGWDAAVVSGQESREGFVVRGCRGNAYANFGDGQWVTMAVNTVLASGTKVRTEPGAFIDLFHTKLQRPVRISGSMDVRLDERVLAQRVASPPSFAAARR
jgi:hypothetical protein